MIWRLIVVCVLGPIGVSAYLLAFEITTALNDFFRG